MLPPCVMKVMHPATGTGALIHLKGMVSENHFSSLPNWNAPAYKVVSGTCFFILSGYDLGSGHKDTEDEAFHFSRHQ